MPSIAGFIQSLLSEDMYATGMIAKMDERIAELNDGQLRLLVRYCDQKVAGVTNKTVLDSYSKLLSKATGETDRRHEEQIRGERERLRELKAAHAGVNAKAWDTSHANLDRELVKFQKFLKAKARRVAEEEVWQEEMGKLHRQILGVPARKVAADDERRLWWMAGLSFAFVVGPILVLCLFSVAVWVAVGSYGACLVSAVVCWFVGVLRGIVLTPMLDDEVIEGLTRKRAKGKLQGYRAEVRRNYEEFEEAFAADMKWRDDWVEAKKKERRKASEVQQEGGRGGSGRVAPEGDDAKTTLSDSEVEAGTRGATASPAWGTVPGGEPAREPSGGEAVTAVSGEAVAPLRRSENAEDGSRGKAPSANQSVLPGDMVETTRERSEEGAPSTPAADETRGPCEGSDLMKASSPGAEIPSSVGLWETGRSLSIEIERGR